MSAITVEGVTKRYRQYEDNSLLLKRLLTPHRSRTVTEVVALDDISFTVGRGETLGIVGRNGSGKTTLLRLLSGVTAPTTGRVAVAGSVAPLIGIGVGFNQELSGRENVRVNGRLLGLTDEQITDRFDDIVAFSELHDFIDVPVKFYSSGMFLRLAFSVAVHTDPEILVVDEILAVGDVGFQAKCDARIGQIKEEGATIVLVTHNLQLLQRLAPRALVLDKGQLVLDGSAQDAVLAYHDVVESNTQAAAGSSDVDAEQASASVTAELVDGDGRPIQSITSGQPFGLRVRAAFTGEATGVTLSLVLERQGFGLLHAIASDPRGYDVVHDPDHPLDALIRMDSSPIGRGALTLRVDCQTAERVTTAGRAQPLFTNVVGDSPGAGPLNVPTTFEFGGQQVPAFVRGDAGD